MRYVFASFPEGFVLVLSHCVYGFLCLECPVCPLGWLVVESIGLGRLAS